MRRQVVVIGAGPTGLWVAAELKLAGIDVVVLDKREQASRHSRSLTIHGRTLETFALRGLADRFLAQGKPLPDWHFGGLPVRLDFTRFEARYPFMLFIPQTQTEKLLADWAREIGVEVRRSVEVTQLVDEGNVVRLTMGSHNHEEIEADFVIGADGARSITREYANIAFKGEEATFSVMMADATTDLPAKPSAFGGQPGQGGVSALPLGNGQHRVICFDPSRSHVDVREPLTLIEFQEAVERTSGGALQIRNPTWLSRFGNETKLAQQYRKGRVFLAGDSAHIHAPMGGQGMNVGIQDAMNLAWKLASVIKEHAPSALLDSYEKERRPVGERLFVNTLAQSVLATMVSPAGKALRTITAELLQYEEANRAMAAEVSGFGLSYPDPLIPDDDSTTICGERMPDSDLEVDGSPKGSIYGHLAQGRWLSLIVAGDKAAPCPKWLNEGLISTVMGKPSAQFDTLNRYQAMLIRPDGYLASAIPF